MPLFFVNPSRKGGKGRTVRGKARVKVGSKKRRAKRNPPRSPVMARSKKKKSKAKGRHRGPKSRRRAALLGINRRKARKGGKPKGR